MVLRFGGKKKPTPPTSGRPAGRRLELRGDFPTHDVNDAIRHLLRLINRVALLAGADTRLTTEISDLRAEAGRATLPEDYEHLCDQLRALELGSALAGIESVEPRAILRDAIEAVLPVARAIRGDAPVMALNRLIAEADNPRTDLRAEFHTHMERLAESVSWLRTASDVFKIATLDVLSALARLTLDEGSARMRLTRVRDGIERAGDIEQLQALRDVLLQEANALVEEASHRESRMASVRTQVDRVQAQVASLESALADANRMARTDPLTGLGNRRALEHAVARFSDSASVTGVLTLDIDHFKQVNDTHGHDAGDLVIRRLADVMREELRGNDGIFRIGGEEFMVLLPATDSRNAAAVADRIRERFSAQGVLFADREIACTVSVGVAAWTERQTFKQVATAADQALYEAKRAGRNRVALA